MQPGSPTFPFLFPSFVLLLFLYGEDFIIGSLSIKEESSTTRVHLAGSYNAIGWVESKNKPITGNFAGVGEGVGGLGGYFSSSKVPRYCHCQIMSEEISFITLVKGEFLD